MRARHHFQASIFVSTIIGLSSLNLPVEASELLVGSFNNDSVLRYDSVTGNLIDTFISSGSGGLDGPVALNFGLDRHLYVIIAIGFDL